MTERELIVEAGPHERRQCGVLAAIPWEQDEAPAGAVVIDEAGREQPAQVAGIPTEGAERKLCVVWVVQRLRAGEEGRYKLSLGKAEPAPTGVVIRQSDDALEVLVRDQLFTKYHFSKELARPCLYPFIGPTGKGVTRDYPMGQGPEGETRDHVHHRSVWVAHGDVNGADNWSEEKGHGKTVHRSFEKVVSGPVFGQIKAISDWVDNTGKKALEERLALTFHVEGPDERIMDVGVNLIATAGDVVFGDTKEGGIISVRVASSMDAKEAGKIENSYGGISEGETWGKRAHWCDYSGPVDGETVGICIMDDPSSFRHPTYWHVRNYGLMTANPFGLSHFYADKSIDGSHRLPAGQTLRFRYRIYVHRGDAAQANVREKYHDFVNPPKVRLT
jgi:hypothetical protein